MLIKQAPDIRSSEITDERVYRNRRQFIQAASGAAMGAVAGATMLGQYRGALQAQEVIPNLRKSPFSTDADQNSYEDITTYNNFYEFGTDKGDPARYADALTTTPWSVRVEGEMNKPAVDMDIDDLLRPHTLEERIYRLRCVEAWSMVVPWVGFPLGDLLKRFEPTSKAKFVRFTTLYRPEEMRDQRARRPALQYPYVEGLRMDEAMHPLAIIAVGMYGKTLMNQQGPPLRLVVPWKYGFKSIKSIVKIEFVEDQPRLLERRHSQRVRVLFQREPGGQPPPVEPGERAPDRQVLSEADADVQRLRRPGCEPLRRDGPRKELLISRRPRVRGRREPGGPEGPCYHACPAAARRVWGSLRKCRYVE